MVLNEVSTPESSFTWMSPDSIWQKIPFSAIISLPVLGKVSCSMQSGSSRTSRIADRVVPFIHMFFTTLSSAAVINLQSLYNTLPVRCFFGSTKTADDLNKPRNRSRRQRLTEYLPTINISDHYASGRPEKVTVSAAMDYDASVCCLCERSPVFCRHHRTFVCFDP